MHWLGCEGKYGADQVVGTGRRPAGRRQPQWIGQNKAMCKDENGLLLHLDFQEMNLQQRV